MNFVPALLAQSNQVSVNADRGFIMSIVVWLFVGLVAGFLASKVVNKRGDGIVLDIILGLIGAFVGGLIVHLIGIDTGGGIVVSILVATLGAILVLVIYHKLIRHSAAV